MRRHAAAQRQNIGGDIKAQLRPWRLLTSSAWRNRAHAPQRGLKSKAARQRRGVKRAENSGRQKKKKASNIASSSKRGISSILAGAARQAHQAVNSRHASGEASESTRHTRQQSRNDVNGSIEQIHARHVARSRVWHAWHRAARLRQRLHTASLHPATRSCLLLKLRPHAATLSTVP